MLHVRFQPLLWSVVRWTDFHLHNTRITVLIWFMWHVTDSMSVLKVDSGGSPKPKHSCICDVGAPWNHACCSYSWRLYCAAGPLGSFNSNSDKVNLFLHCMERIPNPDFHNMTMMMCSQKKLCNKKMTWRRWHTSKLELFRPVEYLASLHWFCFLFLSGSKTSRSEHERIGEALPLWGGPQTFGEGGA